MTDDKLNAELFTAIDTDNSELILIKQILEKGPDINAKDNNGYTPLMSIINTLPTAGTDYERQ